MRILSGSPSDHYSVDAPLDDKFDGADEGFFVRLSLGIDWCGESGENAGTGRVHAIFPELYHSVWDRSNDS
jgi:hypothetical protein